MSRQMRGSTLTCPALLLALASCGGGVHGPGGSAPVAHVASTPRCAATRPNGKVPPGERRDPSDFGAGRLWTLLPADGRLVVTARRPPPPGAVFGQLLGDGSIATKFPWWGARAAGRDLLIGGTRLDAHAAPLRASVAPGRAGAPRFWASTLTFTAEGCWRVTGRAGRAQLAFVVQVIRG